MWRTEKNRKSEWYPRWMHFTNKNEYRHHVKNYGDPSQFGYHDFVPMFKPGKSDFYTFISLLESKWSYYIIERDISEEIIEIEQI